MLTDLVRSDSGAEPAALVLAAAAPLGAGQPDLVTRLVGGLLLAVAGAVGVLALAVLLAIPGAVLVALWRSRRGSGAAGKASPVLLLRRAGGQLVGAREVQEDELGFIDGSTLDPEGRHPVAVVADGMGGHASGEVASRLAVRAFIEVYVSEGRPAHRLRAALDCANRAIDDAVRDDLLLDGMGTTLVAAAVTTDGLEWISVGDSSLFLYRNGQLKRLNEDHSMAPVIAAMREIDPVAAEGMNPNELRAALVGARLAKVDVSTMPELLQPGDLVLLASDGLNTLDDAEVASIIDVHRGGGPEAVKDALLAAVAARGAATQDNLTVSLIEAPGEPGSQEA